MVATVLLEDPGLKVGRMDGITVLGPVAFEDFGTTVGLSEDGLGLLDEYGVGGDPDGLE